MAKSVIQIEDVSKMYRLGEVGTGTLSHDLHRTWARLLGKPDPFAKVGIVNDRSQAGGDFVWALKDINLEVEEGEILGIIGRNGAGKSTLLKLLSRVTAPTTGIIRTRGRIASLLEVGTGFHPELTGRENIYLNGTILGMTRQEITARLEEIVEFSGCAKYIDTPVKRYSSGMMVRLAFAVAAHLECEILIIDEVLAVGDFEFQKKCLGKIKDVTKNTNKTVLFVSHDLSAIGSICNHCSLISNGKMEIIKEPANIVIESYLKNLHKSNSQKEAGGFTIKASLSNKIITKPEKIVLDITITSQENIKSSLDIILHDNFDNTVAFGSFGSFDSEELINLKSGENKFRLFFPTDLMANGDYSISINLTIPNITYLAKFDKIESFQIRRSYGKLGVRNLEQSWKLGCFKLDLEIAQ